MTLSSSYSAALALLAASGLLGIDAVSYFAFWTQAKLVANITLRPIAVKVLSCLFFAISIKTRSINDFIDSHHPPLFSLTLCAITYNQNLTVPLSSRLRALANTY